ncbi:MAG: hypothetical protein ACRDWG_03760 [Actinomycetes bacterium]
MPVVAETAIEQAIRDRSTDLTLFLGGGCAIRRAKTAMALLCRAAGSFGRYILHDDQLVGTGALDHPLGFGGLLGP